MKRFSHILIFIFPINYGKTQDSGLPELCIVKSGYVRQKSIWRHSPFWALALPQNMPPF